MSVDYHLVCDEHKVALVIGDNKSAWLEGPAWVNFLQSHVYKGCSIRIANEHEVPMHYLYIQGDWKEGKEEHEQEHDPKPECPGARNTGKHCFCTVNRLEAVMVCCQCGTTERTTDYNRITELLFGR